MTSVLLVFVFLVSVAVSILTEAVEPSVLEDTRELEAVVEAVVLSKAVLEITVLISDVLLEDKLLVVDIVLKNEALVLTSEGTLLEVILEILWVLDIDITVLLKELVVVTALEEKETTTLEPPDVDDTMVLEVEVVKGVVILAIDVLIEEVEVPV